MANFTANLIASMTEAIDGLTESIDSLVQERDSLVDAVTALQAGPTPDEPKPTKKSTKGQATGGQPTDPDELRAWRIANLEKARAARKAKAKGTLTRGQQILSLLAQGMSPAEVAEQLGISKGYVYNTRNRAEHAAA